MIEVALNIYRGPRPDIMTCADLQDDGFKAIIDLEWGFFEKTHNDCYEATPWSMLGIELIKLPMSDFACASKSRLMEIAAEIRRCQSNGKVYVHCLAGVDRTGMAIAAYRMIYHGWTYEMAKAELKANGMHWWYYWWIPTLKGLK